MRAGRTPADERFAKWLRREMGAHPKPVIVVANKGEGNMTEADALEFASLGFSSERAPPLLVSAEHNEGFDDLFQVLSRALPVPAALEAAPAMPSASSSTSTTSSAASSASTTAITSSLDHLPAANKSSKGAGNVEDDHEVREMVRAAAKEPVDRSVTSEAPPVTVRVPASALIVSPFLIALLHPV